MLAVRPAPTATPTPTPLARLDDPDARLGLIAELGAGMPLDMAWSGTDQSLVIVSPTGVQTFVQDAGQWVAQATFAEPAVDILQFVDLPGYAAYANYGGWSGRVFSAGAIVPLSLSADGRLLAYQGDDLAIRVWDLASRRLIGQTESAEHEFFDVQISAGGEFVGALLPEVGVVLYRADTGEQLGILVDRKATTMAFSPTEDQALTASADLLQLWDLQTRKVLQVWREGCGEAAFAAVSRGTAMVGGYGPFGQEGFGICLYSREGRNEVELGSSAIEALFFVSYGELGGRISASGRLFAFWFWAEYQVRGERVSRAELMFIRMNDGTVLRTIEEQIPVSSLAFSLNDTKAIAWTEDGNFLEIDPTSGGTHPIPLPPYSGVIVDLALSPSVPVLAVASLGGPVRLWDVNTLQMSAELELAGSDIDFSADGQLLAMASEEKVQVWRLGEGLLSEWEMPETGVSDLEFMEGATLAVATWSGLQIWDAGSGELIRQSPYVGLLPEGAEILIDGSADGAYDVRETGHGYLQSSFTLPSIPIAVSPASNELATVSRGIITLWDFVTGEQKRSVDVSVWVTKAGYSRDGSILAAGGTNGLHLSGNSVVPVNPLSARILSVLEGQTGSVTAIAVSQAANMVATGASDGTVRLWGAIP